MFTNTRKYQRAQVLLGSTLLLANACNSPPTPGQSGEIDVTTEAQLALKAAIGGVETDVEGVKFELFNCPSAAQPDRDGDGVPDGATAVATAINPLGPGFLPDGLARFQNQPLDKQSAHPYSDGLFVVLANTCYVVRATPVKKLNLASDACFPAVRTVGAVPAGLTKEVVLIAQCKGTPKAVVDAVAALNHPPELIELWFEQDGKRGSKFVEECKNNRVCATVLDPDNDPLLWQTRVTPPGPLLTPAPGYPKEHPTLGKGHTVNCWDINQASGAASHDVTLLVRDQVWDQVTDPAKPKLVTIEDFIADFQHEKRLSRAVQTFPLHVLKCDCSNGVDIVFTMDTSGSMNDEGAALCNSISAVQAELVHHGIVSNVELLAIDNPDSPGGFSCLTDTVGHRFGTAVPGDAKTCGNTLAQNEAWGQSTAIISERKAWTPGNLRLIVPISDEASCDGDPCRDPGEDRDSITNAIDIAGKQKVVVSPIIGTPLINDPANVTCVNKLASDLAVGTGGAHLTSAKADDLPAKIVELVLKSCKRAP